MATLVTGGTGFSGQHVVRMLVERGDVVHVMRRQRSASLLDTETNVKTFCGDIVDPESISKAIRGCEKVIHLAAFARVWAKDPTMFYHINVLGTRNVLKAASEAGLQKVVYTSSCSAVQVIGDGIADESSFREPSHFLTEYAHSKFLAQKQVESFLEKGVPVVTVYPTRVYGPGRMTDGNAATKAIALYMRGRLPFMLGHGDGIANWAYVGDVARGHILALDHGRVSERYILGGENMPLKDVLTLIDNITQKKHVRLNLPEKFALAFARFEEFKAGRFGIRPFITKGWVESLGKSSPYSSDTAVRELGYQITPLHEGLKITICRLAEQQ